MTEKRLSYILAAVFLVVGILATWNTFQLHSYIRETLPQSTFETVYQGKHIDCNSFSADFLR